MQWVGLREARARVQYAIELSFPQSLDQKRYAPMFELESGVPFRLHKMS